MTILPGKHALATLLTLALVPGFASMAVSTPASAAPLLASYSASAHGDLVGLSAAVLPALAPSLAGASIGHSLADVDSGRLAEDSRAESANLDASVLFGGVTIPVGQQVATAAPTQDPAPSTLLDLPLSPLVDIGVIGADTYADYADDNTCVTSVAGERVLSDSRTTLAGADLLNLPLIGALAKVGASEIRSTTKLVDDGVGGSDVVSSTRTIVGDVDLLGGRVKVDVGNGASSPVSVRARSNGTTGTSELLNPPLITATVGGTVTPIPLNGQPVSVNVPALPLADVTITAFDPGTLDDSAGAVGEADLPYLLRVQVEVLSVLGASVADLDLSLAPLHVRAEAPVGGVECQPVDPSKPDAPIIDDPSTGDVITDSTPTISGSGAEVGSTVTVYAPDGTTVLCTDTTVAIDGLWSCTPDTALPDGDITIRATVTVVASNESELSEAVTFTIDSAAPDAPVIVEPAQGSSTTDLTPAVSGTAEAGSTVTVTEGPITICATQTTAQGNWTCTPVIPLLPGSHTFSATAKDAAGNESAANTVTFTIVLAGDTTPPTAPVITSPAQGSSGTVTTPPITGSGEPAATVTVTEAGTVVCTATVAGTGSWTCTPATALSLGQHTISATATDAAGNTSPANSVTFTITASLDPDTDGDGLTDDEERKKGTDPSKADTDGDGLTDGTEVMTTKTDPRDPDTDNDRLTDGREVNGMVIRERFEICGKKARTKIRVTTNPLVKDTDKDGLTDGKEVKGYKIKQRVTISRSGRTIVIGKTRSNPTKADTDRDGIKDKLEKNGKKNKLFNRRKSDPTKCDTDRGGVSDGKEIKAGSDPTRIKSGPNDMKNQTSGRRGGNGSTG